MTCFCYLAELAARHNLTFATMDGRIKHPAATII